MRPLIYALALCLLASSAHGQLFRRPQPQIQRTPVYVQPRVTRAAPPARPQQPSATNTTAHRDPLADVPLAAVQEISRLGDGVQEIGTGHQSVQSLWLAAVAAPPPDDSHKWYITVITRRGCGACERLLADFARDPELRAFADPNEYTQSWAHYNVFAAEDQTQKWRWAKIRVDSYPTIILQPPLNRKFGDPKTVVMQKSGYDGNAASLANEIRAALKYYVQRLQDGGYRSDGGMEQALLEAEQSNARTPPAPEIGVDPPFAVPTLPSILPPSPSVTPPGPPIIPRILPDAVRPRVLPDLDLPGIAQIVALLLLVRSVCSFLIALLTSGGLTNLFLLLILLILLIRLIRARRALDLVIDDTILQRLAGMLAAVLPQRSTPRAAAASSLPPAAPVRTETAAPREAPRPQYSRARVRIR